MSSNETSQWKFHTIESWGELKASGMLWEFFPDASGIFEEDIKNEIIYEKIDQ